MAISSPNLGSVPATSRVRFPRCLATTSPASNKLTTTNGDHSTASRPVVPRYTNSPAGTDTAAHTLAKPTYRLTTTTATHTTTATPIGTVITGHKPSIAPKPVATPFPPLNPSQTGYICPMIVVAATPNQHHETPRLISSVPTAPIALPAANTGKNPFNASKIKQLTPHAIPNERPRLVAPMFPLPTSRRLTPRQRAIIHANGIDPPAYPNTNQITHIRTATSYQRAPTRDEHDHRPPNPQADTGDRHLPTHLHATLAGIR